MRTVEAINLTSEMQKGTLTKKCKLGQRGGEVVMLFITTFRIFGAPPYLRNG